MRANGVAWLTGYAATVRTGLAILVTLVACQDRNIEQMTAIKEDVCACKTASCAEQTMKRVPADQIKSLPRTQALARDMIDCLARLQAAERPSTDPDAEGKPEPEGTTPLGAPAAPPSAPGSAAPGSAAPGSAAPPAR